MSFLAFVLRINSPILLGEGRGEQAGVWVFTCWQGPTQHIWIHELCTVYTCATS